MKAGPNTIPAQSDGRVSRVESDALTVRPLPGGLGAEIVGVDLREPFVGEVAQRIHAAFLAHHLVVVLDQQLTRTRMGEFAALFGELEGNVFRNPDGTTLEVVHEISNLDAQGRPAENPYLKSNYHWHTDKA